MRQPRERGSAPQWRWLAFGLTAIGVAACAIGYWMFKEMIAHVRN